MHHETHKNIIAIGLAIVVIVGGLVLYFGSSYESAQKAKNVVPPVTLPEGFVSIKGGMVCLPHINTEGPQTMECAIGFQDEKGMYYTLKVTDPMNANVFDIPMNASVIVQGDFSNAKDTTYQSVGIIEVTSITLANISKQATLTGVYHCLQAKDPQQEINVDCKFGIKTADGKIYSINFGLISETDPTIQVGQTLTADGQITPIEELSIDMWQLYGLEGVFSVTGGVKIGGE